MPKFIDLTGRKFGKLTILKRAESRRQKCGKITTYWLCQCDCGNIKEIRKDGLSKIKDCGCSKNNKNLYKIEKLYNMRRHFIERCYNKNDSAYKNYGERGIKVCNEWLDKENGLNNFCKWALENGYNENAKFQECTIDRIDVNGNYEPNNCRFVSNYTQARNKSNNVYIEYNNKIKIMADWAKEFNIKPNVFRYRYLKGWSIEKIKNTPIRKRGKNETTNSRKRKNN